MKRLLGVLLVSFFSNISLVNAEVFSETHKLGAFSGAMKFCERQYDGNEERYRWARLRVAQEVNDMSGKNKTKALFASDNAERKGTYLGNRLNKRECEGLLKLREWRRFSKR